MSYIVPIHRPTAVRKAAKLSFIRPDEDTLVVAYVPISVLMAIRLTHDLAKRVVSSSTSHQTMAIPSRHLCKCTAM